MAKKTFDLAVLVNPLEAVSNVDTQTVVQQIPVELIDANDKNLYVVKDVDALASSIAMVGLMSPIEVTPADDGRYRLISGHRRLRAWKGLAKEAAGKGEDTARWSTIPAFVRTAEDRLVEELRLIQANSTARVLTSAEIAAQAERLQMLLYELKEKGWEFPGRMRDVVAEALQVSSAKLGRLAAIRKNLIPEFMPAFESGKLNESAAYALQQHPAEDQRLLARKKPENLSSFDVDALMRYAHKCAEPRPCLCGGECDYGDTFWRVGKDGATSYGSSSCLGYQNTKNCCLSCPRNDKCKSVCPKVAERVKSKLKREKAAKEKKEAESAARTAELIAKADGEWARLRRLREAAGVTVEDAMKTVNAKYGYTRFDLAAFEGGTTYERTRDPADLFFLDDAVALADLYHVSLDVLLGREAPGATASEPPCWRPMSETPAEGAWGIVLLSWGGGDAKGLTAKLAQHKDGKWIDCVYGIAVTGSAVGWIPAPAPEEARDD